MLRTFSLCLLLAATSRAELRWERPIQEFERTTEDRQVTATFAFQNSGSSPVTIQSLKSSCGCTTVALEKRTYLPGERGEVQAKFVFGSRVGPQRKIVTVKTDDGATPTILDLRVTVRERVTITPALLYWTVGEPSVPKSAQITVAGGALAIRSITSTNPRLLTRLQTVVPGQQYALSIAPADTAQKESGKIEVVTDAPAEKPRTYVIHVRIK